MDLKEIDRKVVREILAKWPTAQVAGQLRSMGYDRRMIKDEFRAALLKRFRPNGS